MKKRWMVNGHACTPIQSRPGGRKDRCDEISSSRWGFPWRPDLPRFSPLGQGHPSRILSRITGVRLPSSSKNPPFFFSLFSRGGNSSRWRLFFWKGDDDDGTCGKNYPRWYSLPPRNKYGDRFTRFSCSAKATLGVRSTLLLSPPFVFSPVAYLMEGQKREK